MCALGDHQTLRGTQLPDTSSGRERYRGIGEARESLLIVVVLTYYGLRDTKVAVTHHMES